MSLYELVQDVKHQQEIGEHFKKPTALLYAALELAGEAGEVADQLKKALRKGSVQELSNEDDTKLILELGDVLWSLVSMCHLMHITLDGVAHFNQEKLKARRLGASK